jgi:hypothetical protein
MVYHVALSLCYKKASVSGRKHFRKGELPPALHLRNVSSSIVGYPVQKPDPDETKRKEMKDYHSSYYQANREKIRARALEKKEQLRDYHLSYYLKNKEKMRENHTRFLLDNPHKKKEYAMRFYTKNPEKRRSYWQIRKSSSRDYYKGYCLANKEKLRVYHTTYRRARLGTPLLLFLFSLLFLPTLYSSSAKKYGELLPAPHKSWKSRDKVRIFLENLAEGLHVMEEEDWYRIGATQVNKFGGKEFFAKKHACC